MSDELKWIVRRFNWKACHEGNQLRQAPGEHRVAWFDTETDARAECLRREAAVRERVNPFRCGPAFHYLSTFPEYAFRDWLMDAGITPPAGTDQSVWAGWWDAGLPDELRAKVWEGLNRVRFHDVIARRPSEVAYAVVQVLWDYQDDFYSPGDEGGRITTVYRTRHRAEAEAARLSEVAWTDWGGHEGLYSDRWRDEDWPLVREETVSELRGVPQYEVIEIDLHRSETVR